MEDVLKVLVHLPLLYRLPSVFKSENKETFVYMNRIMRKSVVFL